MYKKVILSLVLLLFTTTGIIAHNWYPVKCCNEKEDCFPVVCSEIAEESEGRYSWNKNYFGKDQVYPSQDKECHACLHKANNNNPLCLFIQPMF